MYQDAANLCRQITEEHPTHKDARLLLINLNSKLGNKDIVGQLFEDVLEDFRDSDVLYQAGMYSLSVGKRAQARTRLEEVVARDPGDFEALNALGIVDMEEGNLDGAKIHFEAALAVNPKHRGSLLRLSALLDRQGDELARTYFERALKAWPFDPEVSFNCGVFLVRSGEQERGLEQLKRASNLADDSLFEPAHFALASIHAQSGGVDEARRYLREIVLRTRDPSALQRAQSMIDSLD